MRKKRDASPRPCGVPGCRALTESGRYVCKRHAPFYDGVREDLANGTKFSVVRPQLAAVLCLEEGCNRVKVKGSDHCADHVPQRW